MTDAAYRDVVKETFETKPLRTVLMIDDEFPTFSDLAEGETEANKKRFKQKDRAVALYRSFQKRHMICDVENSVSDVKTERFRKSDLIILDYHLGPADGNETSIGILRELSSSKHFNTIVVYTAETNQIGVWLDVMASLSGGWSDFPALLEGDAKEHWERLSNNNTMPEPSLDAIMEYAKKGELRDLSPATRKVAQDELVQLGVPQQACGAIITGMIHRELFKRAGKYGGEPHRKAVGGYADGQRWIQTGNAFIAITLKRELSTTEEATQGAADDHDPMGVLACLSAALLAWKPNLIQILISEIQNILELEALATEDVHLRDQVTQTALWYYLLNSLGRIDPQASPSPDVRIPLISLIDKIVDGIRQRLSTDPELLALGSKALLGELKDSGWTQDTWPMPGTSNLIAASCEIARTQGVKGPETLFRLNSFLSTERFRRAHITTGTIFCGNDKFFVAASPACDLVARKPGADQEWAHAIHPLTPVVAILLHPVDVNAALANAERAQFLFVEADNKQMAFRLTNGSEQPSYEFFLTKNEGRVSVDAGKFKFDAARLTLKADTTGELEPINEAFEVMGQLRGVNATRVLDMAGQHLSRIGLDFIKMPSK